MPLPFHVNRLGRSAVRRWGLAVLLPAGAGSGLVALAMRNGAVPVDATWNGRGRIVDAVTRRPIAGARIAHHVSDVASIREQMVSDADGRFEVRSPRSRTVIRVVANGYAPFRRGARDLAAMASEIALVRESKVEGMVIDARTKAAVASDVVVLTKDARNDVAESKRVQGPFAFAGLMPGPAVIAARGEGLGVQYRTVMLTPGNVERVDLALSSSPVVRGTFVGLSPSNARELKVFAHYEGLPADVLFVVGQLATLSTSDGGSFTVGALLPSRSLALVFRTATTRELARSVVAPLGEGEVASVGTVTLR